jgi:Bacterial membrane protein YfhO
VVVVAAFATTVGYIRHAWHMFPLSDYQDRIEYKHTEWIAKNLPDQRMLTSGSVRFWFDAWRDLPELGGGSDQGILNGKVEQAAWEINLGKDARPSILWMQNLGVDTVFVSDEKSQEVYKDFEHPRKFEGALPVIFDDGAGNKIYRIPRRYLVRARVVDTAKLNALKPPRFNDDTDYLQQYSDVMEKGPDAQVTLTRTSTDAMRLRAKVDAGQSVVVQESYDPAWQATSEGKALPVHADVLGMMAIDAPAGDHEIELAFVTPLENIVGRIVTVLTLLAMVALIVMGLRREQAA